MIFLVKPCILLILGKFLFLTKLLKCAASRLAD
jgi:hypothetical protein